MKKILFLILKKNIEGENNNVMKIKFKENIPIIDNICNK